VQPPTAYPRTAFTTAEIVALIERAPDVKVDFGCHLLTPGLAVVEEIGGDFVGGRVEHANYSTLHGTASLGFTRELDWGAALVRPWMELTGYVSGEAISNPRVITARFHEGAFYTGTPSRTVEGSPITFTVDCYDRLSILNDYVGDSYSVAAGTPVLPQIEEIILGLGVETGTYILDQSAAAAVTASAMTWAMVDNYRWLNVLNDLLDSVGYGGAWTDQDGLIRLQPYLTPRDRAAEWSYTDDRYRSMIGPQRTKERDFFDTPNRFVFWISNMPDDVAPVEGNGIYTYENQNDGDTSIEARGRTITYPPEGIEAVDHAALVAAAEARIDAVTSVKTKVKLPTAPNPLSGHLDKYHVYDQGLSFLGDVASGQWALPLDGSDMAHEWTEL
jgi:hypothetical protein